MNHEVDSVGLAEPDSNVNGPSFVHDGLPFHWQMTRAEKFAFVGLVESIKPEVAIEIGTYKGGSLQILAPNARKVYSLDVSPEPRELLQGRFGNVEFLVGPSSELVPQVLAQVERAAESLEFVLIDGDHSKDGVISDIEAVLKFVPKKPLTVVFHDSFHPPCREGILQANWHASPYVHFVEVDFVPGVFHQKQFDTAAAGSMYGGLAVARLLPTPRQHDLKLHCSQQGLYEITYSHSCYQPQEETLVEQPLKAKGPKWRLRHMSKRLQALLK
ncbi:MAG TPA: hypothetical protein DDW52_22685 [Planctomycetaceae bacterium]|nr:hypothetical protein [Planctomycetaceae bacterium]